MYLRPQPPARVRVQRAAAAALVALAVLVPAAHGADITFIHINQKDDDIARADALLHSSLRQALGLRADQFPASSMAYDSAVWTLANQRGRRHVARLTPYAFIAAEMLGADLEVLGTYRSKATDSYVYRSYFVVRREDFPNGEPDLNEILTYLESRPARTGKRARFIYHNQFSTSSYFLPSLFFRKYRVFNLDKSRGGLIAIESKNVSGGSTGLALAVASGEADLAAIWDGTKRKFDPGGDHAEQGRELYFVPQQTVLPNDLLVCARNLRDDEKEKIRARLAGEIAIDEDDFVAWVDIAENNEAAAADKALSELRWRAREPPSPVTVTIDVQGVDDEKVRLWFRQAAEQAVRLSGTELVLFDGNYHGQIDYEWILERVRDGHVKLRSQVKVIDGDNAPEQVFRISFRPRNQEDLALRINQQIHSRLHRIRYLWPYAASKPLVIRDVPFTLPDRAEIVLQKIVWDNPRSNEYSPELERRVPVEKADFHKFSLDQQAADVAIKDPIDPMSDVSHRVILLRPDEPRAIYAIYNGVFFALVAGSLLGTVVAVRRGRRAEG